VLIDVLILVVVAGAAWIGFRNGMIQPLLAEVFGLGTVFFLLLAHRDGWFAFVQALFHGNAVLAIFLALVLAIGFGYLGARVGGAIRRMPVVQGADGFVGLFLQTLIGVGFCYVLISGLIAMDKAFTPSTTTVDAVQLQGMEQRLRTNPFTASAVNSTALEPFLAQASKPAGVRVADLPGIGALEGMYSGFLRPQLAGSHLAPAVMAIGRRLPGVGHTYTSRDLPRRR
jgi:hypothetical protein